MWQNTCQKPFKGREVSFGSQLKGTLCQGRNQKHLGIKEDGDISSDSGSRVG